MATKRKQETTRPLKASQLHKALSHELRLRILTILVERSTASPVEMARLTGVDVSIISHHTKQLVKYGCAEEVETKQRRGATEHIYRATDRPFLDTPEWEKLPLSSKLPFTAQIAQAVTEDLELGFRSQTIDKRTDRHLARTPLVVDEQGWAELQEIHMRATEETLEVQAQSDARRARSGEEGIRASSSQLCFELPPLSKDPPMNP